jgi:hypothetical protein
MTNVSSRLPPAEWHRRLACCTHDASTEVSFEEEADMLLAIAGNDAAKVWINGTLAWQDTGLSAWRLDEGFRKVSFKRGFNTVLVRIEQGPGVCHWSVLLCPTDP